MKAIRKVREMREFSDSARKRGRKIAFVPTMGYLHEGHLSLLKKARGIAETTVMSIFVNPLQFGPGEDFRTYPRDLERDMSLAKKEGCNVLFLPSVIEMYPQHEKTRVHVQHLSDVLCGRVRPGHFAGVTTVVAKLLNAVNPNFLILGRKDAQQAVIIERMVKDLHFPVKVIVCPTVREEGGLAMSSRNKYLSNQEREEAKALSRALSFARTLIEKGEQRASVIRKRMKRFIEPNRSISIEYISLVDPLSLEEVQTIRDNVMIALAARVGEARLIDNILANSR